MNKQAVAARFLQDLREQEARCNEALRETRGQVIDAPSANQSHSDTSKSQLSNVVLGQQNRLEVIRQAIRSLESLSLSPRDMVVAGSAFAVQDENQGIKYYFMFPGAQPVEIETEGITITSLTAKSPLGAVSLTKRVGAKVAYPGGEVEIIEIW